MRKACVCGRSATYPICDNTHVSEAWSCVQPGPSIIGFCAGPRLWNVASYLASAFSGALLDGSSPTPDPHAEGSGEDESNQTQTEVDWLFLISDGADLLELRRLTRNVASRSQTLIVFSSTNRWALQKATSISDIAHFDDNEPAGAIAKIEEAVRIRLSDTTRNSPSRVPKVLDLVAQPTVADQATRVFVSHSVADERALESAVGVLRATIGTSTEFFLCSDSIAPGANWRDEIRRGLDEADVFLLIVSRDSVVSPYCAYEFGYAEARELHLRLIGLDETAPPAFAQHIQMASIPRQVRGRPWLSEHDALVIALAEAALTGENQPRDL